MQKEWCEPSGNLDQGEFKHEVRKFQKPYDNQQAEQNPKNTALCTIFMTYTRSGRFKCTKALQTLLK